MRQFDKFDQLIAAKDPLIYVNTYEESEFLASLCEHLRKTAEGRGLDLPKIFTFSRTNGFYEVDPLNPGAYDPARVNNTVKSFGELFGFIKKTQNAIAGNQNNLKDMIRRSKNNETVDTSSAVVNSASSVYFVLQDLHLFFSDKDILRSLRELKETYRAAKYCPIIVTSPVVDIPPELEKIFTLYEQPLLTTAEISEKLEGLLKTLPVSDQEKQEIAVACTGLTNREIDRAVFHSLAKNNKCTVLASDIHAEKVEIVKKSGALDFIIPTHTIADLGGCDRVKTWIAKAKESMGEEAVRFGVPRIKGAMLVGLPGSSKTVCAEILANYLSLPLLSLNMSKVMGSFVGQSERQIANALRIAKAVGCVLIIDEAEKALGGVQSSNSSDSGALARVMGQILSFLAEENTGVITVMTSNDVTQLPPELLRAGRLDKIFYFDMPTAAERKEIFKIYLSKNRLECPGTLTDYLISKTENFTGAEIKCMTEQLVINSFYRQKSSGITNFSRIITAEDIDAAASDIVTIYSSNKERIEAFRAFSKGRYICASSPETKGQAKSFSTARPAETVARKVSFSTVRKKE